MGRAFDIFAGKTLRFRALRVLATAVVAVTVASPLLTFSASASPSRSPSVRAAARLKNSPPRNWIRHYLGEDRYKIAGGTWKFVSTELDRFYYPPYAPEMLRQSPNRVIGFSSAEDAEEAGYFPAPGYAQASPSFDPVHAGIAGTATRRAGGTRSSQRILLADGASSIVVPGGWRRMLSDAKSQGGQAMTMDMFTGGSRNSMTLVMTMPLQLPRGVSIQSYLTPESLRSVLRSGATSGGVNSTMANSLRNTRVTRTTIGGVRGIAMTMPRNELAPGMSGRVNIVARRNKLYMVMGEGAGSSSLISSLRLR